MKDYDLVYNVLFRHYVMFLTETSRGDFSFVFLGDFRKEPCLARATGTHGAVGSSRQGDRCHIVVD